MLIKVELTEHNLKRLIKKHIEEKTGQVVSETDIHIEVKSKQNYKAEWEEAKFKASYDKFIKD